MSLNRLWSSVSSAGGVGVQLRTFHYIWTIILSTALNYTYLEPLEILCVGATDQVGCETIQLQLCHLVIKLFYDRILTFSSCVGGYFDGDLSPHTGGNGTNCVTASKSLIGPRSKWGTIGGSLSLCAWGKRKDIAVTNGPILGPHAGRDLDSSPGAWVHQRTHTLVFLTVFCWGYQRIHRLVHTV
jgi:hypothetical protein